jgi:hypothetical protein
MPNVPMSRASRRHDRTGRPARRLHSAGSQHSWRRRAQVLGDALSSGFRAQARRSRTVRPQPRSLEPVFGELDVVAQVAADEELCDEGEPQEVRNEVAEGDAKRTLWGKGSGEIRC